LDSARGKRKHACGGSKTVERERKKRTFFRLQGGKKKSDLKKKKEAQEKKSASSARAGKRGVRKIANGKEKGGEHMSAKRSQNGSQKEKESVILFNLKKRPRNKKGFRPISDPGEKKEG